MTPAVTINETQTQIQPWNRKSVRYDGNVDNTTGNATCYYYQYVDRPASATIPYVDILPGVRWRLPSPFHHYSCKASISSPNESMEGPWLMKYGDKPYYTEYHTGCAWSYAGHYSVRPDMSSTDTYLAGMENQALTKALLQLQNQQIHLGNFFGTFKETVGMFNHAVSGIASGIKKFSRTKAHKPFSRLYFKQGMTIRQIKCLGKRNLNKSADLWLEYIYGWSPFLSDLKGALDELSGVNQAPVVCAVGYSRRKPVLSGNSGMIACDSGNSTSFGWQDHFDLRGRASLWYALSNPQAASLSRLGLVNPLEVIWEVTKFSFLVDWFLPIGPWLQTWTAAMGWDFISGSYSVKRKVVQRVYTDCFFHVAQNYSWKISVAGPKVKWDCSYFDRKVYTVSPSPGLYFKNPLSGIHIANSTALLIGAYK